MGLQRNRGLLTWHCGLDLKRVLMLSLEGLGGGVWRWWNLYTERPGGKKLGQGTFNPSTQELSKRMSSETEQATVMYA